MSLPEAIQKASSEAGFVTFLAAGGQERVRWSDLIHEAESVAAVLQQYGIGPNDAVAILGLPSRALITVTVAVWLSGGAVVMLPTPARGSSPAAFLETTNDRLLQTGARLALIAAPFESLYPDLRLPQGEVHLLTAFGTRRTERVWSLPVLDDDDLAVLQLTSGTTDHPRISAVSQRNILANIDAIWSATGHGPAHGRLLSWLPLSHDMGLVGALAAHVTCGRCDLALWSPIDYLLRPAAWLRLASELRVTTLAAPCSAYALAARLLPRQPPLDLSSIEVAICGGENIDADTIDDFLTAAAPHGLSPNAFTAAYGLAEATLAVTFSSQPGGLRTDTVDADLLATAGIAAAPTAGRRSRRLTVLGRPVRDTTVLIVDADTGVALPDRHVGEVNIGGPSVSPGYLHSPPEPPSPPSPPDPVGPAGRHPRPSERWLASGDLGYLVDGELILCGRTKDLIVVAGRNIYAQEVERAALRATGVRSDSAVAFQTHRRGSLGGEGVGVVVESSSPDTATVRAAVIASIRDLVGITPQFVNVAAPGLIPKTPSGKTRRAAARTKFTP